MTHKRPQLGQKPKLQSGRDYDFLVYYPIPSLTVVFKSEPDPKDKSRQRYTMSTKDVKDIRETRMICHVPGPLTTTFSEGGLTWHRSDNIFLPKGDVNDDTGGIFGAPVFVHGSTTDAITLEGREYTRSENWFFAPRGPEEECDPVTGYSLVSSSTPSLTVMPLDIDKATAAQQGPLPIKGYNLYPYLIDDDAQGQGQDEGQGTELTLSKPSRFMGRLPVEVTVRQLLDYPISAQKYFVPIEILQKLFANGNHPRLWRKALQGQPITIQQSYDAFETLLAWLCGDKLASQSRLSEKTEKDPYHMDLLMRLYHAAKNFGQPKLQDEVIQTLKQGDVSLDGLLRAASTVYAKGMDDAHFRAWFKEELSSCLHKAEEQPDLSGWDFQPFINIKAMIDEIIVKGGLYAVDVAEVMTATKFRYPVGSDVVDDWQYGKLCEEVASEDESVPEETGW